MCGIIGAVTFRERSDACQIYISAMLEKMAYRGPDDSGLETYISASDKRVIFGHRRLSIIDLTDKGHQPMNVDHMSIVYNGEIYNYKSLKKELESCGEVFFSDSDTEVILRGYKNFGVDILDKLNGIFAFAIYDEAKEELFLARDRTGVKPLFYTQVDGQFFFASESHLLFNLLPAKKIDWLNARFYFIMGYSPPYGSLVDGIKKVGPGCFLRYSIADSNIDTGHYYQLPNKRLSVFASISSAELRHDVEEVVREQLVSDVKVGTFLSGGLDSSIVTQIAAKYLDNLTSFTTRFITNDDYDKFNTDYECAKILSKKLGIRLEVIDIDDNDSSLLSLLDYYIHSLDEPNANFTTFSTYLVSLRARETGHKVLLSGDGSDEIFGGYKRYRNALIMQTAFPFILLIKKARKHFKGNSFDRYASNYRLLADETLEKIITGYLPALDSAQYVFDGNNLKYADMINYYDLAYWIPDESNHRIDRASMFASIETRVPFQSERLINKYWPISLVRKSHGNNVKIPLKKAFPDLPNEILNRRKSGWQSPESKWFRSFLKTWLFDLFNEKKIRQQGIFNYDYIDKMLKEHMAGKYYRNEIKTIASFQAWYDSNF